MTKRLSGRRLDIVTGRTNLPTETVAKYRHLYQSQGYEVPPYKGRAFQFDTPCLYLGRALGDEEDCCPGQRAYACELHEKTTVSNCYSCKDYDDGESEPMKESNCVCDGPGHCPVRGQLATRTGYNACVSGNSERFDTADACVYLGEELEGKEIGGLPKFKCRMHGTCSLLSNNSGKPACDKCKDRLLVGDKKFPAEYKDFLHVTDRWKNKTNALRDMLAGAGDVAFLACGGPSAKELPLERLNERGCWTMCVNNMAGWHPFRPQAMVFSDPPQKFCDGVWLDPGIMKFCPLPKLSSGSRGKLRTKDGDKFVPLKIGGEHKKSQQMPNVWGFGRRSWFSPDDTFFLHEHATVGNFKSGTERTGEDKTVCTMLIGLRLLYYLGARTIYLVGVDFGMDSTKALTDNYAFGEERDEDACSSNNAQYSVINQLLCRMATAGVFQRFGLDIYNTNPYSALRAFAHVPFDEAVKDAKKHLPEEPFDLRRWYWKPKKKKKR